ncbi:MAG: ABC transporter substrate-binding protein, partial [Candidatus Woesearchaeota archaeon]|nr:ABC transporter substrate-binding protein [Candidatus Woesearchaeota archaeon]
MEIKQILGIALLFLIVACSQRTPDQEKIQVGLIAPLTGPASGPGTMILNSAQIAVDEINQKGGVNGRLIELIPEDDACDPKKTATAFAKLVEVNKVSSIIGPFCSGSVLAVSKSADEKKVVLITPGATSPVITNAGDFTFRVAPSDAYETKILAEYLKMSFSRIGILYFDGQQALVDMVVLFKTNYLDILVGVESFSGETNDVRTQLLRLKEAKIDALLVLVWPDQYGFVAKQAGDIGLDVPFFGTHTFETPSIFQAGKDAEKYEYIIGSYDAQKSQALAFIQAYQQKFSTVPGVYGAFSYDATNILAK